MRIMAIRIDHIRQGEQTVVHIAGRLSGSAVKQLHSVCAPIEGAFVMDLSSLIFADADGIEALRAIIAKGAMVYGASVFIEMLIGGMDDDHRGRSNHKHHLWT